MVKFTILIGGNYLFNYIAQSNYRSFLKNNNEKKKFASLIVRISRALQIRSWLIKEDVGWYVTANFAGKLFDSV